jgi:hypothetical protein
MTRGKRLVVTMAFTDSLLTGFLLGWVAAKPLFMRFSLVVPTGLFPVKTGIYMPNNFKGLDRRPLG